MNKKIAQTVVEYLMLLAVVAAISILSVSVFYNKSWDMAKLFYDTSAKKIMGEPPIVTVTVDVCADGCMDGQTCYASGSFCGDNGRVCNGATGVCESANWKTACTATISNGEPGVLATGTACYPCNTWEFCGFKGNVCPPGWYMPQNGWIITEWQRCCGAGSAACPETYSCCTTAYNLVYLPYSVFGVEACGYLTQTPAVPTNSKLRGIPKFLAAIKSFFDLQSECLAEDCDSLAVALACLPKITHVGCVQK